MDFENPAHLRSTLRDDPVKGPIWVAKFDIPKPTDDTSRDLLLALVDELNDKNISYDRPDSQSLKFEWVGSRDNVGKDTPQPSLPEREIFKKLNAETKRPLAILYLYGGTFVLNTPSSYRKTAGFLAEATGSKVLMVHQHLAPQNPFPAALLDVFQAYLTLLAPPPPTRPFPHPPLWWQAIAQILLRLQRQGKSIVFHGQTIMPIIPAGMALVSPITELTNSLPSYERNMETHLFPVPVEKLPFLQPGFPTCSIWLTQPPRADLYCEADMLAHPLVSPAASDDWSGSFPIWMASGQEQTVDPAMLIAQVAHSQGVSVTHQEYENMPHTFFFFFRHAPQTKKVMEDWVQAILLFSRGERPVSSASYVRAKGLIVEPKDIGRLVPFSVAELRELMGKKTLGFKVPSFHRHGRSNL
ncbi:alpha/beta-hydrolase [Aspergillus sclerotioniger CBS 115572]|uniref:Alpha/beta-hydrolase n=1 Tax=Aspergillus sclerotioniger CBS 115572 TaxID=1450535 RepID=A0A317WFI8_9EURO|nr:alpha/beta-hydrolase [Aspergillus sclerotioniger CBS 115572]PWY84705.1 alpha/beta-hydrolase [Aspergillus sclerotioniger CBS 115572]